MSKDIQVDVKFVVGEDSKITTPDRDWAGDTDNGYFI